MSFANDDLTSILVPPPTQAVRYGQGRILEWDADTFENTVEWRGVSLSNVPVLSGPDALTYQPGDVVGLLGWAHGNGPGTWWIIGRIIIPGAGAGEAAIDWMTTSLGRAVSAAVFADQVHSDSVFTNDDVDITTYGDIATPGPEVTSVEVGDTGRMLVIVSAALTVPRYDTGTGASLSETHMSYEISGPSNRSPQDTDAVTIGDSLHDDNQTAPRLSASRVSLQEFLSPGTYTVTAKYRRRDTSGFIEVFPGRVQGRTLTVIAF